MGWSGQGGQEVSSVSLSFWNREQIGPEKSVEIHSATANQHGISVLLEKNEDNTRILDDQLFRSQSLSDKQRRGIGLPMLWRGELLIDEETFSGELRMWSPPYQFARFSLTHATIVLSGHAGGLTQDELLQTLKDLKVVNQRGETLADYQRELDEASASNR